MKRTSTPEDIEIRRNDILSACETLFETMDYQDINLKNIAERTELSRPSLYNYFSTKEEIFLALTYRYLASLTEDISRKVLDGKHDRKALATLFTDILLKHFKLIEIISVHMTDIERHTTLESLVRFKKKFKEFVLVLKKAMKFQFGQATDEQLDFFWESFTASLFGIYPLTSPSAIQRKAMKAADVAHAFDRRTFIEKTMSLLLSIFE